MVRSVVWRSLAFAAALAAGGPAMAAAAGPLSARLPGPDGAWDYLSADPGRHRIYVARSYGVMAIDTRTGRSLERFADGDRSHAVVVVPDQDVLVVTNSGDNSARIVDAATGREIASIPTGRGADAAVYDPRTRRVWVMNHTDGTISVIDPRARSAEAVIRVGGILESAAVDGRGRLYVAVEDRREIAVLDTVKRQIVRRYRLPGCADPTGLALANHDRLIVACDGKARVLSASDGRRLAEFRIGHDPDAVAYDKVSQRVYVPTGADGRLWVLDVGGPRVKLAGSVATRAGSRKSAVDPALGDIYLPTARFEAAPGPDGKPVMVPGSFSVWVFRPPF